MSRNVEIFTQGEEVPLSLTREQLPLTREQLPLTREQLLTLSDGELVRIAVRSFHRVIQKHGRDVEHGFAVRCIEEETGVGNDLATLVVGANTR